MKIGYFADGPWSHLAFTKLSANPSFDIRFIVPRYESTDATLKQFADRHGIDYFAAKNINAPEFIEKVKAYDCDLFISMSFNQIFRATLINTPPLRSINCHAGMLPFYRGCNVLNWVLINDEREFGITVHYIDTGIDTGDIILQRSHTITDEDDYRTLLDRAYVGCADILYDAVELLQHGTVVPKKQTTIHPVGMYCGRRKEGDETIDWRQPSRDLFNFIRAISRPGPMAQTTLKGSRLMINHSRLVDHAPVYKGIPGQIVGTSARGLLVKTLDTTLELTDYVYDGKISIGDRLL